MAFTDDIDKRMASWNDVSSNAFENKIKTLNNAINDLYEVLRQYSIVILEEQEERDVLANISLLNNIEYLHIAMFLNSRGQYAQARALFRNVYETLVIVKYMMITDNTVFVDKYRNNKTVNLNAEVFKKVSMDLKDKNILEKFYFDLCSFSHFSGCSNSLAVDDKARFAEVGANYGICRILLCLNYHVLNSYCYKSNHKANIDRMVITAEDEVTPAEQRKRCRESNSILKKDMNNFGKNVVNAFTKKWKLVM